MIQVYLTLPGLTLVPSVYVVLTNSLGDGLPTTPRVGSPKISFPAYIRQLHITWLPRHPKQRGGKPPIFRAKHQSLAARIIVKVFHFLFQNLFRKDTNGMLSRLPKPALTILTCLSPEDIGKTYRQMMDGVIKQLTTSKITFITASSNRCLNPVNIGDQHAPHKNNRDHPF